MSVLGIAIWSVSVCIFAQFHKNTFHNTDPEQTCLIAPFMMNYGLLDAAGTLIGFIREEWKMPGLVVNNHKLLPERSFGTF